jgi:hypothetical protein
MGTRTACFPILVAVLIATIVDYDYDKDRDYEGGMTPCREGQRPDRGQPSPAGLGYGETASTTKG